MLGIAQSEDPKGNLLSKFQGVSYESTTRRKVKGHSGKLLLCNKNTHCTT